MVERIDYGEGYWMEFSNKAYREVVKPALQGDDNPLEAVNEVLNSAADEAAEEEEEEDD